MAEHIEVGKIHALSLIPLRSWCKEEILPNSPEQGILGRLMGKKKVSTRTIRGTVVLMERKVLELRDFHEHHLDSIHELPGKGVTFRLVNATIPDPGKRYLSFVLPSCGSM